jgi:hypothetical protein
MPRLRAVLCVNLSDDRDTVCGRGGYGQTSDGPSVAGFQSLHLFRMPIRQKPGRREWAGRGRTGRPLKVRAYHAPPCSGLKAYQRLPPPPLEPAPEGRSVLGRASLTFMVLPSRSVPFSPAIAFWASASLGISTNPNPRGCPESRSVMMLTRSTVPYVSNSERTASSVAPKLRLPTKMLFTFLLSFSNLKERLILG